MSIKFSAKQIDVPGEQKTACAVLPVSTAARLKGAAADFDKLSGGALRKFIKLGDFGGKRGQHALLPAQGRADRLLLVGVGDVDKFDTKAQLEFCKTVQKALASTQATEAALFADSLPIKASGRPAFYRQLSQTLVVSAYRYTQTLSKPKPPQRLARMLLAPVGDDSAASARRELARGTNIGEGINEARELANLPGNICTPTYLAQRARQLARGQKSLTCKVLDEKHMRELGMGSLLSVSAGSAQPAKLIALEYKGGKASEKPYVLVGKGITFDSGGISLKPGAKMDEMKFDMGGAASVLGVVKAVVSMQLPMNVVGVIAAAENMPSSTATKPGDVVTSMSGKTIEILNTDAEGRLVLCDAMTWAQRYKPAAMVDIATLTGACIVALGSHASGLFANDDKLADQLLEAGQSSQDRAWRLPIWEDYQKSLNSNFADIANIGGPGAGAVTAACFLARFAEDTPWAHLDIAGSAWNSAPKGATGRPVGLLIRYLMDRAGVA
ncbi:MAG: leucyl aminopeptidase [Pseudomonadota bacterium]